MACIDSPYKQIELAKPYVSQDSQAVEKQQ